MYLYLLHLIIKKMLPFILTFFKAPPPPPPPQKVKNVQYEICAEALYIIAVHLPEPNTFLVLFLIHF